MKYMKYIKDIEDLKFRDLRLIKGKYTYNKIIFNGLIRNDGKIVNIIDGEIYYKDNNCMHDIRCEFLHAPKKLDASDSAGPHCLQPQASCGRN